MRGNITFIDERACVRACVRACSPSLYIPPNNVTYLCGCTACFVHQEAKCAYGILVMAVYWVTEALPLPVTALLPVVLFPTLGVEPAKSVATNFIKVRALCTSSRAEHIAR